MDTSTGCRFRISVVPALSGFVLLAFAPVGHAADWHIGADAVTRVVYTDGTYGYDQLRLKAGYRLFRKVAVEFQVMGGGADTDFGYEGYRRWSAGPSYGFFIKPIHGFHHERVEVYGLLGATRMETRYTFLSTGFEDVERIWSGAGGVGMQYNFASGLTASIDVLWTFGEAKYPHLYDPTNTGSTVTTATAAAGLSYRF